LNLLKKIKPLKPYLIIIILIIYIEVIGNGKLTASENQLFFYEGIIRAIEGASVGVFLYILNLDDLKLTFKINVHCLIIALLLTLTHYYPYSSFPIPGLLYYSPVILYVFPVLIGYYLSKGLISIKNNSDVSN
jgi:hypothetical protein